MKLLCDNYTNTDIKFRNFHTPGCSRNEIASWISNFNFRYFISEKSDKNIFLFSRSLDWFTYILAKFTICDINKEEVYIRTFYNICTFKLITQIILRIHALANLAINIKLYSGATNREDSNVLTFYSVYVFSSCSLPYSRSCFPSTVVSREHCCTVCDFTDVSVQDYGYRYCSCEVQKK